MERKSSELFQSATWSSTSSPARARPSRIWRITSAAGTADKVGAVHPNRPRAIEVNRPYLQLPNGFPAHHCPDRAPFYLPAIEGRIARRRLELVDLDRPFQVRIDQSDIGRSADRKSSRFQFQQFRRLDRVHLDQTHDIDLAVLMHQQIEKQSQLGFESDNSKRRRIKL